MHAATPRSGAVQARSRLDRLTQRLFSFPAVIVGILIAKAFWTCRSRIADPDIWWHLRNADVLVSTHHFPNSDTYSFTAAGAPWVNHAWLSELVFFFSYRALGLRGLFVVSFLAVAALSLSIFFLCRRRTTDPLTAALATIAGGLLAMVGFAPRTQLFGWLCFVAVFAILLRFRTDNSAPLWPVPILFCLWINCHAGWPFGLVILGIVLAAGLVPRDVGPIAAAPWSSPARKKLLATLVLSTAALFLNPFGYRLVWYPFDVALRQKLNVRLVEEWASVNFNDDRGLIVMIVLGAVFLMALAPRQRWRLDDAALTAFALYGGLTHVRMLLPAGIILPPILAPQLGTISSYDPARERRLLNAVVLAGIAAVLVFGSPSTRMLQAEAAAYFPVGAVDFLRSHPQDGKMFNSYEWGGYLGWELPETKVFIDSRTDIFEYKGVLKDYVRIGVLDDSQELLDRYGISLVLYTPQTPLAYFLSRDPGWQEIYRDTNAVLFRRARR